MHPCIHDAMGNSANTRLTCRSNVAAARPASSQPAWCSSFSTPFSGGILVISSLNDGGRECKSCCGLPSFYDGVARCDGCGRG